MPVSGNAPAPIRQVVSIGAGLGYVGLHWAAGGLRPDHIVLALALALLACGGRRLRPVFDFALPLILMVAVFDGQRYLAGNWHGSVHVAEPRQWDLFLFGIREGGSLILPSQWWQAHTSPLLDAATGAAYIVFVPMYVVMAWYFYRYDGRRSLAVMWCLPAVTVLSMLIYYLYPAAPPWYVDLYGLGPANPDALPSAAGAVRFDAVLGLPLMAEYYSRTPNVFGAIPSLHAAVPMMTVYWAFVFGRGRTLGLAYLALVCFAAVYLNHHYVIDVVLGLACALVVVLAVDGLDRLVRSRAASGSRRTAGAGDHG